MRNEVVVTLLVVALLAGAGAGYLVGMDESGNQTSKGATTITNTSTTTITTITNTSTSTSTECTVNAEGQVLLHVLNSTSGKPIPDAPVQAQVTPFYCNSTPPTTISLNTTMTNGTGYAEFGADLGIYHLTLTTYGNYFVYASTLPEQTTCVTLSIPSGETIIKYSGSFQFSC
jgi:5-hydroxyisourate hydrolase-like protein (transthyretin family)